MTERRCNQCGLLLGSEVPEQGGGYPFRYAEREYRVVGSRRWVKRVLSWCCATCADALDAERRERLAEELAHDPDLRACILGLVELEEMSSGELQVVVSQVVSAMDADALRELVSRVVSAMDADALRAVARGYVASMDGEALDLHDAGAADAEAQR